MAIGRQRFAISIFSRCDSHSRPIAQSHTILKYNLQYGIHHEHQHRRLRKNRRMCRRTVGQNRTSHTFRLTSSGTTRPPGTTINWHKKLTNPCHGWIARYGNYPRQCRKILHSSFALKRFVVQAPPAPTTLPSLCPRIGQVPPLSRELPNRTVAPVSGVSRRSYCHISMTSKKYYH
jgi:hypothetical protein